MLRNAQAAFRNAIQSGVFTEKTAGEYMYMQTKDVGDEVPEYVDCFKHINTREYTQVFASDMG